MISHMNINDVRPFCAMNFQKLVNNSLAKQSIRSPKKGQVHELYNNNNNNNNNNNKYNNNTAQFSSQAEKIKSVS